MVIDTIVHRWLKVPYALHVSMIRRTSRKRAPIVLFIHGIGDSGLVWNDVIAQLPTTVDVLTIDLLGFGESPRPHWAIYDAKTQARSIATTILKLRLKNRLIIVGHSLGALVSVEVAKRYPFLVKSLILCSPPFYNDRETRRLSPNADALLKQLYRRVQRHPEQFLKISSLAMKYHLVNSAFNVTKDNITSYMGALEASIVNQTSLSDAKKLKKPMTIIHGSLDPVVVKRNIRELVDANKNATPKVIVAGHEIRGRYIPAVVDTVLASTHKSE